MKKLFILFAFLGCTLANVYAQSDSSGNKLSKIRAAKKPIYAVDGIRQSPYTDFKITSLNPENIEAVKILKGEEAIKLYGVEAIDGAVLITTKTGKNNTGNLDLEKKFTLLNLEKSTSILSDFRFTPKTTGKTDSKKPYSKSHIIFGDLTNSIDKTMEPVYVLDGDKVEKNSIIFLSPESIKSVTVLKNSDATTLYGEQALNGVIIITTKPASKLSEKAIDKN